MSKPDILLSIRPLPEITNKPRITVEGIVELGTSLTVNGVEIQPDEQGSFYADVDLSEGLNTIVIAAEDFLGGKKEIIHEVVLDTVPPSITIKAPQPGQVTRDAQITIVGTTDPTANVSINGIALQTEDGLFAHEVSLEEGENVFVIEAVDAAGNAQTTTLSIYREPTIVGVPLMPLIYTLSAAGAVAAGLILFLRIRKRKFSSGEMAEEAEGPEK
jgi:hypothetical protein